MKAADMHCDTISGIYNRRRGGERIGLRENDLSIDLLRLKEGGYVLQNFALFTHLASEPDPYGYAKALAQTLISETEKNPDLVGLVKSRADLEENLRLGRLSAVMTIEEGAVCRGDLNILREFYGLGVRMMTLTWNFPNELAFPNRREEAAAAQDSLPVSERATGGPVFRLVPETERGLTETGIAFVREMEQLGILVDVSHLGDAGFWDVVRYTKKPFVASHSNCRVLARHARNLTDEMIRAIAMRGGVIGINFCASFLRDEEDGREPVNSRMEDMIRHMKHMEKVGGIGCIGLGSDFDGISSKVEFGRCEGIQRLADAMRKAGFTASGTEAVFSGNILRLYRETL